MYTLNNLEKVKECYSNLMNILELQSRRAEEIYNSKEYQLGNFIFQIIKYMFKPKKLIKKIIANRRMCTYRRQYPYLCEKNILPKVNYECDFRIAVYTVIFGNYDKLWEPVWKPDNCDFYVITDQEVDEGSKWRKIDAAELNFPKTSLSDKDKNRYYKMFPYKVKQLAKYQCSVYIDGSVEVISDLTKLVNIKNECGLVLHRHSLRDCVYEEIKACKLIKNEDIKKLNQHTIYLRECGMPYHYGMVECAVIVREHNNPIMCSIMEEWWEEYYNHARRDQLSLPFVLYKKKINIDDITLLGNNIYKNTSFLIRKHAEKV